MEAILFPTHINQEHDYGVASHYLVGTEFYPSTHNHRDRYALPSYEIIDGWVYPTAYNTFFDFNLPLFMFSEDQLISTGNGQCPVGLPMFEIRCLCPHHALGCAAGQGGIERHG